MIVEKSFKRWIVIPQKVDLSLTKYPKSKTQQTINKQHFLRILSFSSNFLKPFTDWSKDPVYVVYAFTIDDEPANYKIHPSTSITSELLAIHHCL